MMDQDENREMFEEQVEILFKAFNEERFSHRGKHYTLPPKLPTGATSSRTSPSCRVPRAFPSSAGSPS